MRALCPAVTSPSSVPQLGRSRREGARWLCLPGFWPPGSPRMDLLGTCGLVGDRHLSPGSWLSSGQQNPSGLCSPCSPSTGYLAGALARTPHRVVMALMVPGCDLSSLPSWHGRCVQLPLCHVASAGPGHPAEPMHDPLHTWLFSRRSSSGAQNWHGELPSTCSLPRWVGTQEGDHRGHVSPGPSPHFSARLWC